MKKKLPKLIITDETILSFVEKQIVNDLLIVTDSYNYPIFSKFTNTVLVNSCKEEVLKKIKENYRYSKILAIGGCTALDVARACCYDSTELICLPTILSTTCISCDRSKISFSNGSRLIKTTYPNETIISLPTLLNTAQSDLIKWTQSGFGDLFANISASIDFQYQNNNLDINKVRKNVPEAFEAVQWVLQNFKTYDRDCLLLLSNYLHLSSLEVIKRDNTELSAGGEHILYHKIKEKQDTQKDILATHGQIVGIGALITTKIFAEYTGHEKLYLDLKMAYKKLMFPVNFTEMEKIGIQKGYLQQMLVEIRPSKTILGNYFPLMDLIF